MVDPPLYDLVNTLYHGVMDHMPAVVNRYPELNAILLGGVGSYSLVRGLQWLSKHGVDKIAPGFDEKVLPTLEKICAGAVPAGALVYAAVDPENAHRLGSDYLIYTLGMISSYFAALGAVVLDFHNRNVGNDPKEKKD